MARDYHGDPFRNTSPYQVSHRCSAKVVRNLTRQSCLSASPLPGPSNIFDSLPMSLKDEGAVWIEGEIFLPLVLKEITQLLRESNYPPIFVLGTATVQPYRSSI